MALPTGAISMSQVNTELGRSSTAAINFNETNVRKMALATSGAVDMDTMRGGSAGYVASGGTITTPDKYKVHKFNSSSTFSVTTQARVFTGFDYLIVAGGGGGGGCTNFGAGGAGAGGLLQGN